MRAAKDGNTEELARQLNTGWDVNARVESLLQSPGGDLGMGQVIIKTTALVAAVAHSHEAATLLLLDRGADPNLADALGNTPLMVAAADGWLRP